MKRFKAAGRVNLLTEIDVLMTNGKILPET